MIYRGFVAPVALLLLSAAPCAAREGGAARPAAASVKPMEDHRVEERNRATARNFLNALYAADNGAARAYLAKGYVEHQISAGFSAEGLFRFARDRVAAHPDHYLVIQRTIAQGDKVFLHVEERLSGTDSVARGEMFRFTPDGHIAEHWSTQQVAPKADHNNNGMFRGSEVNRASIAGRRNGVAIMENDATLFRTLNPDLVEKTRTSRYIQHNPGVPNGPAGLKGFITYMKENGTRVEVKVGNIVAEGDYVAALNYFRTTPRVKDFGEVLVFDIVRVTDRGKVDEHWDIVEDTQGVDPARLF